MILRSAGFVTSDLIRSQNAVNFAYILYLRGRAEGLPAADIERLVRRWYAMSLLRGRYSGSPETAFDFDIRQIESQRPGCLHRCGDRERTAGKLLDRHAAAADGHLVRPRAPTSSSTRRRR